MEKDRANFVPDLRKGRQAAYRRVYETFREAIRLGELMGGRKVPSSRDLASRYGVARITVTQAYEQLVAEGYLETRQGAGTFVASELPDGFFRAGVGDRVTSTLPIEGEREKVGPRTFLSGYPDFESFPREAWLKLLSKRLRKSVYSLNTYGSANGGLGELREAIASHLRIQRGVRCEAGQILILSGSQPGLDLVARVLLRKGDRVVLEDPCFRGMVEATQLAGAEVCPIRVDEQGLAVEALRRLRTPARLAMVTPARQFPTGAVMPLSRQVKLVEWAKRHGTWLLEDDYDSEFRFRGKPLPAMQGQFNYERILYLGTFSRSMFPDMRIGFLVVPEEVYPDFLSLWRAGAMNPPEMQQAALAAFLREGHYERHVRKMRKLYAERCRLLTELVERELGGWLEPAATDGGLHLVGYFREKFDVGRLVEAAAKRGVALTPLSRYRIGEMERDGLLLGFSSFEEEEMQRGVAEMREVLGEMRGNRA